MEAHFLAHEQGIQETQALDTQKGRKACAL